MLARKVVTRSGRKIRGYFPSVKMGRMVAWESLLERDAILLMEFSPGVLAFREQPVRILYSDGVSQREYYPDFEITLQGEFFLHVEVKPYAKLACRQLSEKLQNVATHYQRNNREFRILTDKVIRRQPLLSNLQSLAYLKRNNTDQLHLHQQFSSVFAEHQSLAFDSAASVIGRTPLLQLIASGRVACDLDRPMSGNSLVRIPTEGDHAALLF